MAVFLSNHSLLVSSPCLSSSVSSKPFETLQSKTVAFSSFSSPNASKSVLGFNGKSALVCNSNRRIMFNSYSAAQDSYKIINDEREETRNDVNMKALVEAYKDAILYGDENTAAKIEARIQSIEDEKNELSQKVLTLSADKIASKEKYIRLQADFDNFRKRSEKERLNIQSDAQREVFEKLLLMVDNFERVKQQIKPATEKERRIDTSYQGIYKQFVELMRSHRVAVVATVGKPFDPSLQEAVGREQSQKFKEGIVIQEIRRGFLLRDRLLRPALVKVSSGPGNKKSK